MTGDRDELARVLEEHADAAMTLDAGYAADVLWAAGWRKKPSREELAEHFALTQTGIPVWEGPYDPAAFAPSSKIGRAYAMADAILALLDGPSETGEK